MNNETVSARQIATVSAWTSAGLVVYVAILYWFVELFVPGAYLGPDIVVFTIAFAPPTVAGVYALCALVDTLRRWQIAALKKALAWSILGVALAAAVLFGYAALDPSLLALVALLPPIVAITVTYVRFLGGKKWVLAKPDSATGEPSQPEPVELYPVALRDSASSDMLKSKPVEARAAILQFHRRAQSLTDRAAGVLVTIILVLVFTAAFIIFAGKIAELGAVRMDPFGDLQNERADLQDEISSVRANLSNVREEMRHAQTEAARLGRELTNAEELKSGAADEIPEVSFRVTRIQEELDAVGIALEALATDIGRYEQEHDNLLRRQSELDQEQQEARSQMLAAITDSGANSGQGMLNSVTDPRLLVATGITRFGVLIIAIYLVQILINLYRYNTRTAAHYLAHADVLVGAKDEKADIEAMHRALFPDIEYGKAPHSVSRTFADQFAKAVDRSVKRLRRKDSGDPS